MHNMPGIPVGKFSLRKGAMLAASGRWIVVFRGTRRARRRRTFPHLATDVTIAQAQFVMGIQTIVSRSIAPMDTAVISVGSIHGGSNQSANVMPAEIEITCTMRSFSENEPVTDQHRNAHEDAGGRGGGGDRLRGRRFTLRWGTTPLINHPEHTDVAITAAAELVGAENRGAGCFRRSPAARIFRSCWSSGPARSCSSATAWPIAARRTRCTRRIMISMTK